MATQIFPHLWLFWSKGLSFLLRSAHSSTFNFQDFKILYSGMGCSSWYEDVGLGNRGLESEPSAHGCSIPLGCFLIWEAMGRAWRFSGALGVQCLTWGPLRIMSEGCMVVVLTLSALTWAGADQGGQTGWSWHWAVWEQQQLFASAGSHMRL